MKEFTFNVLLGLMVLTVVLTLVAILFQFVAREDLLKLSGLLFSWQVVGGGLTIAGASTFKTEIQGVLNRLNVPKS
jgi:hypothetical protein